ncbi:protein TAPETUM DETERMINANT 1-like protein [Cinnamomum micranthum f. kanehirae]|uniref:Protein TAPETUM DETERMINANT 1-like protein n=1 Tax=Cinnamomum micranthum f. kanehirae TaxID=337451 RepID=A0A443PWT1_9MAGN|nr:protein TAPETUM DETERMINANT 1-like protein [Cinnamomum micranthum f. kanehirae]
MKRQMKIHTFMSASRELFIIICLMFLLNLIFNASFLSVQDEVLEDDESTTVMQSDPSYLRNKKLTANGICTKRDISISQSKSSSSGIPQYIVQIASTCMSGCAPSNIHVHCGWFASARIVNPNTFKRLSYDDCLVNAGRPLRNSHIIRFTYSNSFMYPLAFKSARFC